MSHGRVIVVTGIMAAGKSTVAQAVAERFPRSAHVRGDQYRRAIVGGRADMGPEPSEEAMAQLRLRYRLAVSTAERYAAAGYTAVLQDVILGPMLAEVVASVEHRPLALVVLAPHPDEVARREQERAKVGYGAFSPTDLDAVLRTETPRLGYWLDSTDLSLEQTVDEVLANLDGPANIT